MEVHALHGGRCLHVDGIEGLRRGSNRLNAGELVVGQYERTDGSVRTDVGTLVTLDTVLALASEQVRAVLVPNRNEGLDTALLVSGSTNLPRTVNSAVLHEVADLQQVTGLSVLASRW